MEVAQLMRCLRCLVEYQTEEKEGSEGKGGENLEKKETAASSAGAGVQEDAADVGGTRPEVDKGVRPNSPPVSSLVDGAQSPSSSSSSMAGLSMRNLEGLEGGRYEYTSFGSFSLASTSHFLLTTFFVLFFSSGVSLSLIPPSVL